MSSVRQGTILTLGAVLLLLLAACGGAAQTPTAAPRPTTARPTQELSLETEAANADNDEATSEALGADNDESATEAADEDQDDLATQTGVGDEGNDATETVDDEDNLATEVVSGGTGADATTEAGSVVAATCAKLNLNELSEDDLMSTIPNFTSRMVREFFEYRPYVSIQQFRREIGKYVDENQVAEWEQYVFVPVDVNNSDADTLMQIPGVDDAAASALMAGRPYASNDAFLEALADHVDEQQLAEAECYLAEGA